MSLNITMKEGRQRTMTSRKSPSAAVADVWTACSRRSGAASRDEGPLASKAADVALSTSDLNKGRLHCCTGQ